MRAFLAVIAVLAALSAVNGRWRTSQMGGRVEIEMSVWGMPFENALYLKEYIPQFERENPGIRVKFHHFNDYGNRILMLAAGGIAPDVMRQNIEGGARYIRRGMNLPLDSFIDGPDGVDRKDFFPIIWDALRYDGKTFGLPQDINIRGLYFNKDLLDSAKLPYPHNAWTWSDLKHAVDVVSNPESNGGKRGIAGLIAGKFSVDWLPFYYQAGGKVWNEDKSVPNLENRVAVESMDFFKGLAADFMLSNATSERGGLGPYTFFQNGQAAMLIDGSWRSPQLKKDAPNLRFGVAPLPGKVNGMSISTSCYWAVSAGSKHPEKAWKLAKFLSGKEQLIRYWQSLWVAPPARWSSLRSAEFRRVTGSGKDSPALSGEEEFQEKCGWIPYTLESGRTTTEFIGPFTAQLYDRLNYAIESTLLEGVDSATALKRAQREITAQIDEARKTYAR